MYLRVLICAILAGAAVSCSEDTPPAAGPAAGSLQTTAVAPVAVKTSGNSALPPAMVPPKDARYTIFCLSVTGPSHVERANEAKRQWQQATGRADWYVLHQDQNSNLYFGYYRTSVSDPKDPRESARLANDRKMLADIKDSIGDQPFAQAMVMPLDAPDPTAPPEWNLVNAKGFWTLEIATYNGRDGEMDRKLAAVESVRAARAQGVEAYYFHGPSISSVCIGSWPKEAIEESEGAPPRSGTMEERRRSGLSTDPQESLMVVPPELAPLMPDTGKDKEGNRMKVVHDQTVIKDPTLIATMRQYPQHAVNGAEDLYEVQGKQVPRPSVPVRIPSPAAEAGPMIVDRPRVDLLGPSNGPSAYDSRNGGRLKSAGQ